MTAPNLAGFASNRGRNLRRLAELEPGGATLAVVLTTDPDAPVVDAARDRDVPVEVVEPGPAEPREAHERRLLERLDTYPVDLVCLDGYMRVLTPTYLEAAPLTLNVHPSLLPAFRGLDPWGAALEAGVEVSGCTVHVVTEELDAGPIVTQEPIPVLDDDTPATLKDRILHAGEFVAYPRAVRWFAEGRLSVDPATDRVTVDRDPIVDWFDAERMEESPAG